MNQGSIDHEEICYLPSFIHGTLLYYVNFLELVVLRLICLPMNYTCLYKGYDMQWFFLIRCRPAINGALLEDSMEDKHSGSVTCELYQ